MAIRPLWETADREAANFPLGSSFSKDNVYVDDLETSMNDPKLLLTGLIQTREALKKYKFVMTKWKSNMPEIVEELGFVCHPQPAGDVTIRNYLSDVQQLFDPLGLLSPATIRSRLALHSMFRQKLKWDQKLPGDMHEEYRKCMADLELLAELKFPRWIGTEKKLRLHGFSDASGMAIAAAVYYEVDGLLTSRARVGPMNACSIPRLEMKPPPYWRKYWHS